MTPINLPKSLVIEKAREAYLAGRLSAQGPTPICAYQDETGHPCVIGAALSEQDAQRLDSLIGLKTIGQLVLRGLVSTDDLPLLVDLQRRHDDWVRHEEGAEATLCRLLSLPIPQTQGGV